MPRTLSKSVHSASFSSSLHGKNNCIYLTGLENRSVPGTEKVLNIFKLLLLYELINNLKFEHVPRILGKPLKSRLDIYFVLLWPCICYNASFFQVCSPLPMNTGLSKRLLRKHGTARHTRWGWGVLISPNGLCMF